MNCVENGGPTEKRHRTLALAGQGELRVGIIPTGGVLQGWLPEGPEGSRCPVCLGWEEAGRASVGHSGGPPCTDHGTDTPGQMGLRRASPIEMPAPYTVMPIPLTSLET